MDELVRSGKVRYVGACNLTGWQLQKFIEVGKQLGSNPWVTLQVHHIKSVFGCGSRHFDRGMVSPEMFN